LLRKNQKKLKFSLNAYVKKFSCFDWLDARKQKLDLFTARLKWTAASSELSYSNRRNFNFGLRNILKNSKNFLKNVKKSTFLWLGAN